MQFDAIRRRGTARAATVAILAGFAGGCAGQSIPAPVYYGGATEPIVAPMPAPPPALQVIVQRGQTLDGYAYTYHLPKSAIIAANGLRPPYELKTGQRLIIPDTHGPVQQAMTPPQAARPWSSPPRSPETVSPQASRPPQTIFQAPPSQPATVQPAPQPQTIAPPPSAAKYLPQIIPLDGPPKDAAAAPPPSAAPATLTPPQAAPTQQAAAPPSTPQASAEPTPGGRFPWPVRGRILANYGNAPGGGHNDGINIAAPLGTPVRAIDAGTVVYSGNEVKGYGNILLIRHANGWISAYAHLDDVAVKQGDTIAVGEVIAKVGNTGGVGEPQLHFELRRGKKPVNPTEFLAPAPSAEGVGNHAG